MTPINEHNIIEIGILSNKLINQSKKLNKTFKSFLLEKNNTIDTANEIFIIIHSKDELEKLKKIVEELNYYWAEVLDESYIIDRLPLYIFFRLDNKHITWLSQDQLNNKNILDIIDNDSSFNGVYKKIYKFDDINNFKIILKTGKIIPEIPTYKPKKFNRTYEHIQNYPYRFKTEEEFIKEYGRDWRHMLIGNTFTYEMNYLLGKPFPYEYNSIDYGSGTRFYFDDPSRPNDYDDKHWYIVKDMLTKNEPTKPNYKPKKFNRSYESIDNNSVPYISPILSVEKQNEIFKIGTEVIVRPDAFDYFSDVDHNDMSEYLGKKAKIIEISTLEKMYSINYHEVIDNTDNINKDDLLITLEDITGHGTYFWYYRCLHVPIIIPNYKSKKFNRSLNESKVENLYNSNYFKTHDVLVITFMKNQFIEVRNIFNEVFNINIRLDLLEELNERQVEEFFIIIEKKKYSSAFNWGWAVIDYLKTFIENNDEKIIKIVNFNDISNKYNLEYLLNSGGIPPNYKPKKFNKSLNESVEEIKNYNFFQKYHWLVIIFDQDIPKDEFESIRILLNNTFSNENNYLRTLLNSDLYYAIHDQCHEDKFFIAIEYVQQEKRFEMGFCYLSYLNKHISQKNLPYKTFNSDDVNNKEKIESILKYGDIKPSYKPRKINRFNL